MTVFFRKKKQKRKRFIHERDACTFHDTNTDTHIPVVYLEANMLHCILRVTAILVLCGWATMGAPTLDVIDHAAVVRKCGCGDAYMLCRSEFLFVSECVRASSLYLLSWSLSLSLSLSCVFFLDSGSAQRYLKINRAKAKEGINSFSHQLSLWEKTIGSCMTKASRKQLDTAWGRWEGWIRLAQKDDPSIDIFRPPYQVYCTFINYYLSLYRPSTVTTYLKRINTAARERGKGPLVAKGDMIWVKRTFRAAAKRLGHDPSQKRLPLTVDILAQIKPAIDLKTQDDRALWAILCVGVFSLARIGELTPGPASELKVRVRDVSIKGSKGSLHLVGTKTDSERKGTTLFFFRNDSVCCPLTAMSAYLTGRSSSREDSPLFVDANNKRITQKWVIDRLRTVLDKVGLRGADYCGISLRRGGAQTLLRMRANDTIIMGMGRWTSSCFNRYLQVVDDDVKRWQLSMASVAKPPSLPIKSSTRPQKRKRKN